MYNEDNLSRRVAHERELRGWTYEGLAKRMSDVGCAIQGSALYKIEKGEPRRRITVDELVALSDVFEVAVEELLIPFSVVENREALAHVEALRASNRSLYVALTVLLDEARRSVEIARRDPATWSRLSALVDPTADTPLVDVLDGVPLDDWSRRMVREIVNAAYDEVARSG